MTKTPNFSCLKCVKSRLPDRLSDSLTSDAEQWHNGGWDWCPQTNCVTSLNNFENFNPNLMNNPNMSVSFLKYSRARRWEESSRCEGSSWWGREKQARALPPSLRGERDRDNSQSAAPLCPEGRGEVVTGPITEFHAHRWSTRAPERVNDAGDLQFYAF